MNTIQKSQNLFPGLFEPKARVPKTPSGRKKLVFGFPRKPGNRMVFLVSFMIYLLGIFPSLLFALPSDPTVQAGSVTINETSADHLTILQGTDKAIIDWRSFGILGNERVDFQLPSSNGVTLNRVTGNEPSAIFGKLTSNGNLFLINPNGILFGAGSQIDVHGLVATTSDIRNEDFLIGNYNFNIPSNQGGIVANRGTITASQGGLVALVAPGVQNNGVIQARLGRVSLASGNTFTLDLYGDQLINLGVGSDIAGQITGLDGEILTARISNSGQIFADGGTVLLDVDSARGVVDQVINMSGVIQARTAENVNGTIVLRGGDTGTVDVSGRLDVSGLSTGETGGTLHVFGEKINLFDGAFLNASGDVGGGTILVGGDYQGLGDYPTASEVFVDRGASIFNDAITSGHGGKSIFWANRRMRFFGSVYARGGREWGDGGFIEVSGKEELFFDGWADTSAPNGLMGTLLLDPEDIVIADGSGATSGTVTQTIFEDTLEALNTNIELLANNSITLNDLSDNLLSLNISGSVTLTLTATNGGITFLDTNDKIKAVRNINLIAGGALNIGSLESTDGGITLKGQDLVLNGTLSSVNSTTTLLSSNGGTIGMGAGAGTFSLSGAELQKITAANLVIGDSTTGDITVDGVTAANSNNIAGTTTLNATGSGKSVTFSGTASTFNGLAVNAQNGVTINNALTTDSGSLSLSGGTTITLASGISVSSGGTLSLATTSGVINAQGAVTVSSANGLTLNGNFTSEGATTFDAGTGSFTVASTKIISTGDNALSVTGANIVLNGNLDSGTGTTTLLASTGGTIGLGVGTEIFQLSNSELGKITAGNLTIGDSTNGDISVDGATVGNNITGATTLNATKSSSKVTFANNASTFNALTVNAGNGVEVKTAVTTDTGDLKLSGGAGSINGIGTTNLTATNGGITLNSNFSSTSDASLTAGTDITLASGISVSSGGTLSLATTSSGVINAQGAVTVSSANGLTLNDNFTSAGTATFDAGTGSFTVASTKIISTGDNALSVTGANIVLNGNLDSGTGTTTLLASTGGTIGLGVGKEIFQLSNSELGNITAGNLTIGDSTNGDISVDGVTSNITGTTTLNATKAGSNINFNNNASSFVGAVGLVTGGNATLTIDTTNNALTLASSTIGGNLIVTVAGGNGLIVGSDQTAGGTIALTAGADITLTGGLFSSSALSSAISLTSSTGGIFDGDATGALDISAPTGGLEANSFAGFGTLQNPIETKLASVDININNTGTGDINIFETDGLNIVNINHSGTGDIRVSYFGTLTGESNAITADGTKTFVTRNSGGLLLPEFGKTLSEVSTDQTVAVARDLESNYFFGSQPLANGGDTVTGLLSGPSSGPFVTNVFNENFELIQVARKTRKAHKGLRGFARFWGPQENKNTEMVKRPPKKSVREEAKLRKKSQEKRKRLERKRRAKMKNARLERLGDTAALSKNQRKKKPDSWLSQTLETFFKK